MGKYTKPMDCMGNESKIAWFKPQKKRWFPPIREAMLQGGYGDENFRRPGFGRSKAVSNTLPEY